MLCRAISPHPGSSVCYRTDKLQIRALVFHVGSVALGRKMNFTHMNSERLLAFYENVRQQVSIDLRAGGKYRFAGDGVKAYADKLREEIDRRRLNVARIEWPEPRGVSNDQA
jgi:hypothetical protein